MPRNHDADVTRAGQEICYNYGLMHRRQDEIEPQTTVCEIDDRGTGPGRSARAAFAAFSGAQDGAGDAGGVLAIVGALAGGYYFAMRPVTLKIAVGPANSDDVKVVQALTQAFAQHKPYVRLRPVQTDGATASAEALAENKVDLAIVRGDLDVPKNAQAVATLRKNFVVLWVPPPGKGKARSRPEDHQDRAARRPPRRRGRPDPGQRQPAEGDPAAIRRRSRQGRGRAVPGQ